MSCVLPFSCAFQFYGSSSFKQVIRFHRPSISKSSSSCPFVGRSIFFTRRDKIAQCQATGAAEREAEKSEAAEVGNTKPANSDGPTPTAYGWFVAFLLLAINVHNQWTRALVYYLVSFKAPDGAESSKLYMNKDLNFGEEQYAILASFGFTALFTVFSLLAGRVADKFNRAQVVIAGTSAWSLANVAQASASSFQGILDLRALTGVSQAFLNPQVARASPALVLERRNSVTASSSSCQEASLISTALQNLISSISTAPPCADAALAAPIALPRQRFPLGLHLVPLVTAFAFKSHPPRHAAAAAAAAAVSRRTGCWRPTSPHRCRPR
jgi:MFS family permease